MYMLGTSLTSCAFSYCDSTREAVKAARARWVLKRQDEITGAHIAAHLSGTVNVSTSCATDTNFTIVIQSQDGGSGPMSVYVLAGSCVQGGG